MTTFTIKCLCNLNDCFKYKTDEDVEYCEYHNIIKNIEYITTNRNPYFKNKDLLHYKVIKVLSKIKQEVEDDTNWIQDYDKHCNTLKEFNDLLEKATGTRLTTLYEDKYVFEDLNEFLSDLSIESASEGPSERVIELYTHADNLVEYLQAL